MSFHPHSVISVSVATRLWLLCLALLLATLPVASYAKALSFQGDNALDIQLESRTVVHEYQGRLSLSSETLTQTDVDHEPPDWLAQVPTSALLAEPFFKTASVVLPQTVEALRYRFFQPLLRAPPAF